MTNNDSSRIRIDTILVASPDEAVRRSVFNLLESRNIAMNEAQDFQSCVSALLFNGPHAAVILDPDISTFGSAMLVRLITGASFGLPCVIITGPDTPAWAQRRPVVSKPIQHGALSAALNSALSRRQSTELARVTIGS